LADIRAGEYEGLAAKIRLPEWRPDFGPAAFDAQRGATVIGARDFLAAYNVNLDTASRELAHEIACDVRTSGRVIRDPGGAEQRVPGTLRAAKAIGWYIPEYGRAQVSMNLTQLAVTPVHAAFEAVRVAAAARGVRVTGSELIGLLPLRSLLEAGRHFAGAADAGAGEDRLLEIAVCGLGLDDLGPFDPTTRVIERLLRDT
ncbi:MAG: glutamate formimidoyltransferase, partial [Opitutaceae bacterium]